jgi:hypothetical protein
MAEIDGIYCAPQGTEIVDVNHRTPRLAAGFASRFAAA